MPSSLAQCVRCGLYAPTGVGACTFCGQELLREATAPRILDGRYLIEGEIGRGGSGVVYLARDENLDRRVAVKLILQGRTKGPGEQERLRREASTLARLRSDYVVAVHAFGVDGDDLFFVMEYVRGKNLGAVIADHRLHKTRVPLLRAVSILRRLARGLDAVHGAGIAHRDVKPQNVVVEAGSGRPVLVDFGLSTKGDAPSRDERGALYGTAGYVAPELLRGATAVSPATDLYAFACTAFALLAGRSVFLERDLKVLSARHRDETPPRLSSIVPELAPLDPVMARALAKAPGGRPRSAMELVQEISRASEGVVAGGALHDSTPPPSLPPGRERPSLLVVDDDPVFRTVLSRAARLVFPDEAMDIVTAASGEGALVVATGRMPRILLLDHDMPGLDGVTTLTRLRDLPGGEQLRVGVVSGHVDETIHWRFSVLGVTDFLRKPFDPQTVVAFLTRMGENVPGGEATAG